MTYHLVKTLVRFAFWLDRDEAILQVTLGQFRRGRSR